MSKRSRAREVVLQLLYQQDLAPGGIAQLAEEFLARRLHGNEELLEFARGLLKGVLEHRAEVDQHLAGKADHWSLERMAVTDRNILRLGAFEILFTPTPGAVVINEAVELAKRYGAKSSPQFVNGVLDRFLRENPKTSSVPPADAPGEPEAN